LSRTAYSTGADDDHGVTPSPVRAVSAGASQVPSNPVTPAAVVGAAPAAGNPITGALPLALALPPVNQPAPRAAPTSPPPVTGGPAPIGPAPVPITVGPAPIGPAPTRVPVTVRGTIPDTGGSRRAGATAIPPDAG
jgi:hypothetical protein